MKKQYILTFDTDSPDKLGVEPAVTSPELKGEWDAANWLSYYSQCCVFLLALGQKFISLITQASVYTTAVCAAMIAMHKEGYPSKYYLFIGITACFPMLVYWHFIMRYRKQIFEAGSVIKDVELELKSLKHELRLLERLRNNAPVYGLRLTTLLSTVYPLILMAVLISLGLALSGKISFLNDKSLNLNQTRSEISSALTNKVGP